MRHLCHLFGPEMFLVIEDEKPNITKDVPIALIDQEIPRVWGAMSQEFRMETKYISYQNSCYPSVSENLSLRLSPGSRLTTQPHTQDRKGEEEC